MENEVHDRANEFFSSAYAYCNLYMKYYPPKWK